MTDDLPPETVVRLDDPGSSLRGFVILHSTVLGPAAGGCRLWRYDDESGASADALRLAAGMTLKNALAGLPLGGGKAVLMLPDPPFDRARLFKAFGRAVKALGGRYVTAEDVGTGVADMAIVGGETMHVAGLPDRDGRPGGDPSPWTARGVFRAMAIAVERRLGRSLGEVTVAVQGVGNVGFALCGHLHAAGARLIVADARPDAAARAAERFGAAVVSPDAIAQAPADVYAPCALGGAISPATLPALRATVVCGAANNQLSTRGLGEMLARRGVLYAPDFLVNAGGIINVAAEHLGWEQIEVEARVDAIAGRLRAVLDAADARGVSTEAAAVRAAREAIEAAAPARRAVPV